MPERATTLPLLRAQADRLISLGLHLVAGLPAAELRAEAEALEPFGGLLVLHPDLAPASSLAQLIRHADKPGFVVEDLTDVDDFAPIEQITLPGNPCYVLQDPRRHDELLNRSPEEALPAILASDRTPLTLGEGLHWLMQCPDVLERGRCFMTIGSRRRRANGSPDTRVPAIWISNGTGRDGRERRHAPKVGWCWSGNRHAWLGFATGSGRRPDPAG